MSKRLALYGRVVRGVGAGRKFMSHPYYVRAFKEVLGCIPYPGTVNVASNVDWRLLASKCRPAVIPGTSNEGQELGAVYVWRAVLKEPTEGLELAVIRPLKSVHPPEVLELVACTRLSPQLSEGSEVRVEVECLEEPPYTKPPRLAKR